MKVDVFHNRRQAHHIPRCKAFLEGMGDDVSAVRWIEGDKPPRDPGDVALFWSGRFPNAQRTARRFLLLESARWLGNGEKAVSVGWNGYSASNDFCADPTDDSRAWVSGYELQPWQHNPDGYVLLFGQVSGDYAARGVDLQRFYQEAAAWYRERGCDVRFRPHPHGKDDGPKGIERASGDLREALAGASLTVSWTTTAGCDAIAAGVPSVVLGPESMAYQVAANAYTLDPPMPDREPWLNWLGQTEWEWDEVKAGVAWNQLRKGLAHTDARPAVDSVAGGEEADASAF